MGWGCVRSRRGLIAAPHDEVKVGEVADTASVCSVRRGPPIPNLPPSCTSRMFVAVSTQSSVNTLLPAARIAILSTDRHDQSRGSFATRLPRTLHIVGCKKKLGEDLCSSFGYRSEVSAGRSTDIRSTCSHRCSIISFLNRVAEQDRGGL